MKKRAYLVGALLLALSVFCLGIAQAAIQPSSVHVRIPAGTYLPFYSLEKVRKPVAVKTFMLDAYLVTNADYLAFVKNHSRWQKSQVAPLFADPQYLKHWPANLKIASNQEKSPVVNVSWFAAKAYCQAQGKRLPTVDQWEYAARADKTRQDASQDPAFNRQILDWYSRPTPDKLPAVGQIRNAYGLYDMHGLSWEWARDFNSILITGESREDAGGVNRGLYCAGGATGAADPSDYAAFMRYAFRSSLEAHYTVKNLGFRCAKEL